MLESELCEIELLTSDESRYSNVIPTSVGSGGAAAFALRVTAGFFFGALFFFFFDWPSTLGTSVMSRTARIATRREGRIVIGAKDTFLSERSLQSWCYGSATCTFVDSDAGKRLRTAARISSFS